MSIGKLFLNNSNELEIAKKKFDTSKDCLIVAGGPSMDNPKVNLNLENTYIFRCNTFYLEKKKTYGTRIDAYFCNIYIEDVFNELRRKIINKDYYIKNYFFPFEFNVEKKDKEFFELNSKSIDPWSIISTNSSLSRFLMNRPLPTTGLQMLSCAAIIGFKKIYIAGLDLYNDNSKRYSYSLPSHWSKEILLKHSRPGYANDHSLEIDLKYLNTLKENFELKLVGISEMEKIKDFLDITANNLIQNKKTFLNLENKKIVTKVQNQNNNAFILYINSKSLFNNFMQINMMNLKSDIKIYALIEESALKFKDYLEVKNLEFIPIKNNLQKKDICKEILTTKIRLKLDKITFLSANILPFEKIDEIFKYNDSFFEDEKTGTLCIVSKDLITHESLSIFYENKNPLENLHKKYIADYFNEDLSYDYIQKLDFKSLSCINIFSNPPKNWNIDNIMLPLFIFHNINAKIFFILKVIFSKNLYFKVNKKKLIKFISKFLLKNI